MGFQGDLTPETMLEGKLCEVSEHGSRSAGKKDTMGRENAGRQEMMKKFGGSSVKALASVIRIPVNCAYGLEFLSVKEPFFQPCSHENGKVDVRGPPSEGFTQSVEGGNADAPGYQDGMGDVLFQGKPVPQRTENIQEVSCLTFGKPGRPLADDPVEKLDPFPFHPAMHTERPPQKGHGGTAAADAVELSGKGRG
jgi:hypothetical protein